MAPLVVPKSDGILARRCSGFELRPGGRVYQVEYRGEDSTVQILPHHKMTVAQARKEMEAVGLRWLETIDDLPQQHVLVYEKPR